MLKELGFKTAQEQKVTSPSVGSVLYGAGLGGVGGYSISRLFGGGQDIVDAINETKFNTRLPFEKKRTMLTQLRKTLRKKMFLPTAIGVGVLGAMHAFPLKSDINKYDY